MKKLLFIALMSIFAGCFSFNFGTANQKPQQETEKKEIILANPMNVYKTSTNAVLKLQYQNKKGDWIDYKSDVLIPSGWYIVSGAFIDGDEETK